MIFLSAIPDEYYFYWQYRVQVFNFIKNGISPSSIYILVGYRETPEPHFLTLTEEFPGVNVLFYEDKKERKYSPSIRPFLISQFYKEFPHHTNSPTFYHDSDIIFHRMIDFEGMDLSKVHLSDTDNYIGFDYVKNFGTQLLLEATKVVGVNPHLLLDNRYKAGGAQYVYQGTSSEWWSKVESDCEEVYKILSDSSKFTEFYRQENHEHIVNILNISKLQSELKEVIVKNIPVGTKAIQAWTADMWVLLWSWWRDGTPTVINPQLSFSWPWEKEEILEVKPIFHNAGVTDQNKKDYFYKHDYKDPKINPLELQHGNVKKGTCSSYYVKVMNECNHYLNQRYMKNLENFNVRKAYWGNNIVNVDVTIQVRELKENGFYFFQVNPEIFPPSGNGIEPNFLIIEFDQDGEDIGYRVYRERSWVLLPLLNTDRAAIFYTNNQTPDYILRKSVTQLSTLNGIQIIGSVWNKILDCKIPQVHSKTTNSNHTNLVLQILQLLTILKSIGKFKWVSFLEHDLLYPQEHFYYPDERDRLILFNRNYIGVSPEGFQKCGPHAYPLHQLTMNIDYAYEHFLSLVPQSLVNPYVIVEPYDRSITQDYHSTYPPLHFNHGKNFTTHYTTFLEADLSDHPYYGKVEDYYPQQKTHPVEQNELY